MNEQNLVPLTTSKAREIGAKGGKASGIAKKERKLLADSLREFLNEEDDNKDYKELGLTKGQAIILRMIKNVYNNPTADDVLKLQKILGEDVIKVDFAGAMFKIETTLQNKDNLDKI